MSELNNNMPNEGQSNTPLPINPTPENQNNTQGQENSFNNQTVKPEYPNSNLALAIIATVAGFLTCCGWGGCASIVLGIIAIVFASSVDSKYAKGNYSGANIMARRAKTLSLIALGLAALSIIYVIISYLTMSSDEMSQIQDAIEQLRETLEGLE